MSRNGTDGAFLCRGLTYRLSNVCFTVCSGIDRSQARKVGSDESDESDRKDRRDRRDKVGDRVGGVERESLSELVNMRPTNDICVRTWMKKACVFFRRLEGLLTRQASRKSTLVFCVSIAHCLEMANTFRSYGIDARIITSKTPKSERLRLLEDFGRQEYPVLVNCGKISVCG